MRNAAAVWKKQMRDTLKNKTVLMQFVLFPIIAFIMNQAVQIEGMPENFFVNLFAAMYIGMAPLASMAAVISEEKESNTLRVLRMSNVKAWEYLTGVGSYIWLMCMAGAAAFCAIGRYQSQEAAAFLMIMAAGILASLLIGAAIGVASRTQMMATSMMVPVMMIFSFLPMLSIFNSTIAKIAKYTYSEQVSILLRQVGHMEIQAENVWLIAGNMLLALGIFGLAYRKCGLE